MGLPSRGLDAAIATLNRRPRTAAKVIGSVAGFTKDELVECAVAIEPHVDAVEIGLICPNSKPEERLEELQIFTALTTELKERITKPLFLKLPPYFDNMNRKRIMAMLDVCLETAIDGVCIQGNGRTEEPRLGAGRGSLSGRPALPDTLRIVREVAEHCNGRIAIRASGGVFTGEEASQVLQAGADAVEAYTAFIYRGWNIASLMCDELAVAMASTGVATQVDLPRVAVASS
jgi:dihydroorotate dehydrogenase